MVGIILLIIIAIGYALCGDTSGVEAIGKGILYIALFLGVCWIIVEIPWLLILVVIGIIIWAIVSSNNTNTNTSNTNNAYDNKDKHYENKNVINQLKILHHSKVNYSRTQKHHNKLKENNNLKK